MQIRLNRDRHRKGFLGLVLLLVIIVVGVVITWGIYKMAQQLNKPQKPQFDPFTNAMPTNNLPPYWAWTEPYSQAQFAVLDYTNPAPTHGVIWGAVSSRIPDWFPDSNGAYGQTLSYVQLVDLQGDNTNSDAGTLNFSELCSSLTNYGLQVDPAWGPWLQANGQSYMGDNYAPAAQRAYPDYDFRDQTWFWNLKVISDIYPGYIQVEGLEAPPGPNDYQWHTLTLLRSSDLTHGSWTPVATNQFMKGLFQLWIDPNPGTGFYRTVEVAPSTVTGVQRIAAPVVTNTAQ